MFSCYLVFWNVGSHIESSILSLELLIINLQPATRRTHCWKSLGTKIKLLTVRKKKLEKNFRKKNWKKIVEKKFGKAILKKKKIGKKLFKILKKNVKNKYFKIPLIMKKVMGNGSELHCSL